MRVAITCDSTCDLGENLQNEFNIAIMPLYISMDGKSYIDGKDVSPEDIYASVAKTKTLPKTSCRSPQSYVQFFTEQLEKSDELVHFCISSELSGSYANALEASRAFNGKVKVVDSRQLSTGQGLLALYACDLAAEGKSAAEIFENVEAQKCRVNTSFVPATLDYLYKGGRCSVVALYAAKLLSIHPHIQMDGGKMIMAKKYLGSQTRYLREYVNTLYAKFPRAILKRCFITHSGCNRQTIDEVTELVKSKWNFERIIVNQAGCTITGHCGPNCLGVLFLYE